MPNSNTAPSLPIAPGLSGTSSTSKSPKKVDAKNAKSSGASTLRKTANTVEDVIGHHITRTASEYWAPGAEVNCK
jgi:hypothetical protein